MKILIVVDMQNDFIEKNLPAYNALNIIDYAKDKINSFSGEIIYTMDTHNQNYLDSEEGKNLPIIHCKKGTYGWKLIDNIYKEGSKIFEKDTFASKELVFYIVDLNSKEKIESIEIIGVCTDICVISNANLIKTFLPNTPIYIDANACAGTSLESHNNALSAMEKFHIKIKH